MKEILQFLKALQKNNNREWFEANRAKYLAVKNEFQKIVEWLIAEIAKFEPGIEALKPGDCIFRINRDIRFSKNKSPYKENFGAFIAIGGKKSMNGGYYFHLQPGNESMVAGGIYMPTPELLKKIRQEIDYNPEPLLFILKNKTFCRHFDELTGDRLKRVPQGYPEDHPYAGLLKLKSYIVARGFSDKDVYGEKFLQEVLKSFKAMKPLNDYLKTAVDN